MTGETEPSTPEIARFNARLQEAIDATNEPVSLGNVVVAFEEPDWVYGDVWARGECQVCGAESVMRVRDRAQMRYLAMVIIKYRCPERGHDAEVV